MSNLENFRLKVFRTVARHLSFRRAAEHLFLTQPAVTLQIKALEEELGVRLFDRAGGRVSLTHHGRMLLPHAEKMAAVALEAETQAAAGKGELAGDLALGVSTTIAQYVLPRIIGAFLEENPRVRLRLRSGNTEEVVRELVAGRVAIGLIEGPARHDEVRAEPFLEDELVLVAPSDHGTGRMSSAELLQCRLLMREQGSGSRRVVEVALEKAGLRLKAFHEVLDLDSTEAIKAAVEAGLGVGIVSRTAITKELLLGTLKVVAVAGLRVSRNFSIVRRRGPEPRGAASVFRRFAVERARMLSAEAGRGAPGRRRGGDKVG